MFGCSAECCSARRRVVKAASGVERVLSEIEARPSVFGELYHAGLLALRDLLEAEGVDRVDLPSAPEQALLDILDPT